MKNATAVMLCFVFLCYYRLICIAFDGRRVTPGHCIWFDSLLVQPCGRGVLRLLADLVDIVDTILDIVLISVLGMFSHATGMKMKMKLVSI